MGSEMCIRDSSWIDTARSGPSCFDRNSAEPGSGSFIGLDELRRCLGYGYICLCSW